MEIEASTGPAAEQAARQLKESIIAASELFKMAEYVLSDELSLVDCSLGPLLWRLSSYGVKLGRPGASVEAYAHRIFSKASFKSSLTQAERDLVLGVS
jgi:RNA polymerase-associated protein